MFQTTVLEIDSYKISIVYIDTDSSLRENDMVVQVGRDLVVNGDNNMSVLEVSYGGEGGIE